MSHSRAHRLPPESVAVVRRFFAMTNKSYRKAGMNDMVVKVTRDGYLDRAPTAPRALNVVPSGGTGLTLMWKPSSDDGHVRAYRIFKDGKLIATVRGSTWFTDQNGMQSPGNYEVKAVDDGKQAGAAAKAPIKNLMMAQQAEQGANGAAGAPQAVQGAMEAPHYSDLKATDATTFQVTWKPIAGAVAYGVYQDGKLIGHTKTPQFSAKLGADGKPVVIQFDAVAADGTRSAQAQPIGVRQGQKGIEFAAMQQQGAAPAPPQGAPQGAAAAQVAPPGQPAAS